jgi:hypothetical protein
MKVLKRESNSETVETNWRKGKSFVKEVDIEAVEKAGQLLLCVRGMQVVFVCAATTDSRPARNSVPVDRRIAPVELYARQHQAKKHKGVIPVNPARRYYSHPSRHCTR